MNKSIKKIKINPQYLKLVDKKFIKIKNSNYLNSYFYGIPIEIDDNILTYEVIYNG